MAGPLDYLENLNFNTKHFQKFSQIVETFPGTDRPDVKVCICRCWQSKKFPYCDGTHKLLVEYGDRVGPYVAVLKAPKTAKTNVVKIKHPLASKNRNYVANPVAKVAILGTLVMAPILYFSYKSNLFGKDVIPPRNKELTH